MASNKAAGLAVKAGYENVYVFRGGLPEWIGAGYPTVTLETLPKVDIPTISSQGLKTMLDSGEDFILLDIRIPVDAKKFWIDSPLRLVLSMNEIPQRYSEIPKGKKIIVIDKVGKRAALASRYLFAKGFKDLTKVSGGMNHWFKSGMPTELSK